MLVTIWREADNTDRNNRIDDTRTILRATRAGIPDELATAYTASDTGLRDSAPRAFSTYSIERNLISPDDVLIEPPA